MASFDRLIETRWAYAILAGLVLLLALPGHFSMPVLDRDEGRFVEASSEMMESGDYVVIRYHNDLRNKKPVAIHWFQSAAVSATSGAAARHVPDYRIPSLLGAMLAAAATLWAGNALFSRRAAFLGGLIVATTLIIGFEANVAKTDAAQCGILVLGMGALAHIRAGSGGKWHGVLFWVCLAGGVLLKGPIAPLVCFSTVAGLFLWERKYEWAKPLLYWVGLSLFCIMTIPWYVAVQIATQGDFLEEAVRVDLGQKLVDAAEGHDGPPGFHLAGLPILFWPGTLLLIPGIWLAISKLLPMRRKDSAPTSTRAATALAWEEREAMAWRFLACWIIPSWLVFEIAPTKLPHYTLPMYPALALMAGAAADHWFSTNEWKQGRWLSLILFGAVAALVIALPSPWVLDQLRAQGAEDFGQLAGRVASGWKQAWDATGIGIWPSLLLLLAVAGTIYALIRKHAAGLVAGLIACSAVANLSYWTFIIPNQSWALSTNASLSALKEICALPEGTTQQIKSGCDPKSFRPPKKVRAIAFAEPSLVFELANKIDLPPDAKPEIPSIAEDNRPAWLINIGPRSGQQALDHLIKAAVAADRCIRLARRYSFNYSNGDPSILVAAVVEPAGCPNSGPPPDLRDTEEAEPPPPELDR